MIRVTCPNCNAQADVDDQYAGRQGSCAKCQAPVRVPATQTALPAAALPRPKMPRRSVVSLALSSARCLMWGLCVLWTLQSVADFVVGERHAESAIQEAAGAAMCSFHVIAAYVICRALDAIGQRVDAMSAEAAPK